MQADLHHRHKYIAHRLAVLYQWLKFRPEFQSRIEEGFARVSLPLTPDVHAWLGDLLADVVDAMSKPVASALLRLPADLQSLAHDSCGT